MVIFGALLVLTLRFARDGLLLMMFQRLFRTGPRAELRQSAEEEGIRDGEEVDEELAELEAPLTSTGQEG